MATGLSWCKFVSTKESSKNTALIMKFSMSIGQTITNNHTKFHYKSESRSEDMNDSFLGKFRAAPTVNFRFDPAPGIARIF